MAKDSFHPTNLLLLLTETFESTTGMSPELMNYIFHFVERPDDLRFSHTLRKRDSVYHCTESLETWKAVHCLHSHTLYTCFLKEKCWENIHEIHLSRSTDFVLTVLSFFLLAIFTSCLSLLIYLVAFFSKSVNLSFF